MTNVSKAFKSIKVELVKTVAGNKINDKIRNIYVEPGPEEFVRQKTIDFIQKNLGVNLEFVKVEEPVCHYGVPDNHTRMDIVVNDCDNKPLLVIECKAPNIMVLAQQVLDQAVGYVKAVNAKYFAVTNGIDMHFYAWEEDEYKYVEGLLSYKDMLNGEYEVSTLFDFGDRFQYASLWNKSTVVIGKRLII